MGQPDTPTGMGGTMEFPSTQQLSTGQTLQQNSNGQQFQQVQQNQFQQPQAGQQFQQQHHHQPQQQQLNQQQHFGPVPGKVTVRIIEARDIPVADKVGGKSDPYIVARHGQKTFKTQTKKKTLTPRWDETFIFSSQDLLQFPLVLELFDWDRIGKNDSIGKCQVSLLPLLNQPGGERWLAFSSKGEVNVDIKVDSDHPLPPALQQPVPHQQHQQEPQLQQIQPQQHAQHQVGAHKPAEVRGKLIVRVLAARNLRAADWGGSSDPFCSLTIGSQKRKTDIVKKSVNPVWQTNNRFEFDVKDKATEVLHIDVLDWDKIGTDNLGFVRIPLDLTNAGVPSRTWHRLEDNGKKKAQGELELELLFVEGQQGLGAASGVGVDGGSHLQGSFNPQATQQPKVQPMLRVPQSASQPAQDQTFQQQRLASPGPSPRPSAVSYVSPPPPEAKPAVDPKNSFGPASTGETPFAVDSALWLYKNLDDLKGAQSLNYFHTRAVDGNPLEWQVDIEGPAGTPFEGFNVPLKLTFDETFPLTPPTASFMVPVFHPNVSPQDNTLCVRFLSDQWNERITIANLIMTVRNLLSSPDLRRPINQEAKTLYASDGARYRQMVWSHLASQSHNYASHVSDLHDQRKKRFQTFEASQSRSHAEIDEIEGLLYQQYQTVKDIYSRQERFLQSLENMEMVRYSRTGKSAEIIEILGTQEMHLEELLVNMFERLDKFEDLMLLSPPYLQKRASLQKNIVSTFEKLKLLQAEMDVNVNASQLASLIVSEEPVSQVIGKDGRVSGRFELTLASASNCTFEFTSKVFCQPVLEDGSRVDFEEFHGNVNRRSMGVDQRVTFDNLRLRVVTEKPFFLRFSVEVSVNGGPGRFIHSKLTNPLLRVKEPSRWAVAAGNLLLANFFGFDQSVKSVPWGRFVNHLQRFFIRLTNQDECQPERPFSLTDTEFIQAKYSELTGWTHPEAPDVHLRDFWSLFWPWLGPVLQLFAFGNFTEMWCSGLVLGFVTSEQVVDYMFYRYGSTTCQADPGTFLLWFSDKRAGKVICTSALQNPGSTVVQLVEEMIPDSNVESFVRNKPNLLYAVGLDMDEHGGKAIVKRKEDFLQ